MSKTYKVERSYLVRLVQEYTITTDDDLEEMYENGAVGEVDELVIAQGDLTWEDTDYLDNDEFAISITPADSVPQVD